MNYFETKEISRLLAAPDHGDSRLIDPQLFSAIYSLGRDAKDQEEYNYAFSILVSLCGRKSPEVRAQAILSLSLLAVMHKSLKREIVEPIIRKEWEIANAQNRAVIDNAVDDMNYSVNNSEGCRGTITFHEKYIVAVFRSESKADPLRDALSYFEGAPEEIIKLAGTEALQYMLDDWNGGIRPVITAAAWGTWEQLFSNEPMSSFMDNCDHILSNQLLDFQQGLVQWSEYYEFDQNQKTLISWLFQQKKEHGFSFEIKLDTDKAGFLYGEISECAESLEELNIYIDFSDRE